MGLNRLGLVSIFSFLVDSLAWLCSSFTTGKQMIKKASLLVNDWIVNEQQPISQIQLYQSIQCGTGAKDVSAKDDVHWYAGEVCFILASLSIT